MGDQRDLNPRPSAPQADALNQLSYGHHKKSAYLADLINKQASAKLLGVMMIFNACLFDHFGVIYYD